jgi:hypothetical protein
LQVLRRVRNALLDLVRELVDRAFPLSEDVDDLGPPAVAECTRYRRLRIEQRSLRRAACHIFNSSLEDLK